MANLCDIASEAMRKNAKNIESSLTKTNSLYDHIMWQMEAKKKGTPEYYEWVEQVVEHLNEQREAVRKYIALPWWKRIFSKPDYIATVYRKPTREVNEQ